MITRLFITWLCFQSVSLLWTQQTISLSDGAFSNGRYQTVPTRDVLNESNSVTVTYTFSNALIYDVSDLNDSKIIVIDGFDQNRAAGEPAVLFRNDSFIVPSGSAATIEVLEAEYECSDAELVSVCVNAHNKFPYIKYAMDAVYVQNKSGNITLRSEKFIFQPETTVMPESNFKVIISK